MYQTNGNMTVGKDKWVSKPSPEAKEAAAISASLVSLGRSRSTDKSLGVADYMVKGAKWLFRGWGDLLGGGQTGIDPDTFSSSVATEAQAGTISGSSFKKSGGLGSLFSTLLGGGTGISLGGIISGIGSYFTEKAKAKLEVRKLDILESQGKESNAINRLIAEGNISENKRRTAIQSTFMGHTSPIAAVEGVNVEPGLVVADTWTPKEVNKKSGGALGTSNNGLITRGQQRQLS